MTTEVDRIFIKYTNNISSAVHKVKTFFEKIKIFYGPMIAERSKKCTNETENKLTKITVEDIIKVMLK